MTAWLPSETVPPRLDAQPAAPWTSRFTRPQAREFGVSRAHVPVLARPGPRTSRDPRRLRRCPGRPNTIEFRAQALRLVAFAQRRRHRAGPPPGCTVLTSFPGPPRAWRDRHLHVPEARHASPPRWRRQWAEPAGPRKALHRRRPRRLGDDEASQPRATSDGSCGASTLRAALDEFLALGVGPRSSSSIEVNRFKGYRGVIELRALAPTARSQGLESVAESRPPAALARRGPAEARTPVVGLRRLRRRGCSASTWLCPRRCSRASTTVSSSIPRTRIAPLTSSGGPGSTSQRSWHIEVFTKEDVVRPGR